MIGVSKGEGSPRKALIRSGSIKGEVQGSP